MKNLFTLLLILSFAKSGFAHKKTKVNRGSNIVKALVSEPEDLALEFQIGEALEAQVTEWIIKNREIQHRDSYSIGFLSMSKSEINQGTNVLMKIKENNNPSEVLMIVFPDDGNSGLRIMYITKEWITQTIQVVLDIACLDTDYNGPTENGFNVKFSRKQGERDAEGNYSSTTIQEDLDVTLSSLKTWNGGLLVFENSNWGESKIDLLRSSGFGGSTGDVHRFGAHPDGKFLIDYTESSIRVWDMENEITFTLPLTDIVRVLFQE